MIFSDPDNPPPCGTTASPVSPVWRHSSHSQGADQTCVDVSIADTGVAVRDSKNPVGPLLQFSIQEWHVFLLGARDGEFDLPDSPHAPDA